MRIRSRVASARGGGLCRSACAWDAFLLISWSCILRWAAGTMGCARVRMGSVRESAWTARARATSRARASAHVAPPRRRRTGRRPSVVVQSRIGVGRHRDGGGRLVRASRPFETALGGQLLAAAPSMPRAWSSSALAVPDLMVVLLLPRADASGASRLAAARPASCRPRRRHARERLALPARAALARSRPPPASQYSLWLELDDARRGRSPRSYERSRNGWRARSRRVSCSAASPAARSAARARSSAARAPRVARAVRIEAPRCAPPPVEPGRARRGRAQRRARRGARRARGAFLGDATEPARCPWACRTSLLYGAHDAAARDAAAAAAREQLAGGVRSSVGALQLWATGGGLSGVRGWHRVATFPLEGGSR